MASSRASTPGGRSRATKRSGTAKATPRKRSAGTHKAGPKAKGAKAKPKAVKPKAKAVKAKPKAAKPRSVKAKSARPKKQASRPASLASRVLTIAIVAGLVTVALAAVYFFWFRDSSFVAVEKVTVEGISGPEAAQVTDALERAGKEMTTLNVDEGELADAVSRYPTVVAVQTDSDFPHGLTVEVTGRPPVLMASAGGTAVPVAADGTVLRGVDASAAGLPAIQVESVPVKGALEGEPLALAEVAGAAPEPLRPLIEGLAVESGDGIEVTLKGGIPVKFGDPDAAEEKWAAVSAILADPQVETLTYLDVRVPERPSIGGAAPPVKG